MDLRVGCISSTYVKRCLQFYESCLNAQVWDEMHNVPIKELDVTLDKFCKTTLCYGKGFVLIKEKLMFLNTTDVTKKRKRRAPKKAKVKKYTINMTQKRRERKSMLCNCSFQIRIIEPLFEGTQIERLISGMAIILVHTKPSGHQPGTDTDKLFLVVCHIVVSLAMENLKQMVSTSTVALAFRNEERKIMSMVGGLKQVTF